MLKQLKIMHPQQTSKHHKTKYLENCSLSTFTGMETAAFTFRMK